MVRHGMTSSFSYGHISGKPSFTVTEIHQEPKFFTSEPFLDWNEDILSLPRGRDLNQRRAFGNWQARAAEFCRTSVRLLDLRTFQVWVLVYHNNKLIFKSNLLGIHTAKCSLSSFCLFALCRKKTNIGSIFQLVQWYWIPKTCMPPRLLLNLQMSLPPSGWQWT